MSVDSFEPNVSSGDDESRFLSATRYSEPRWVAGEIMLLLITVATMYIFVALMYYSWRFRHMARVSGSGHEMRERYLHYSCAAVVLIALARCILHQIISFLPIDHADELETCRTMMIASRIVYNLAICLTYVHLWLRQHMFYTNDEIKNLRTRVLEIVDWSVFVIIVCTSVVMAIVAFVPLNGQDAVRRYHPEKCNVFEYSSKESLFIYVGLSLLYQLVLVLLFLYPILLQQMQQKREKANPVLQTQTSTDSQSPALWRGIRRGFILTILVILTDALSGFLVWFLTKRYPDLLSSIIGLNDVNLIFNVVCCICTFRNWKKIVFGFEPCRRMGWHHDYIMRSSKGASLNGKKAAESGDNVSRLSFGGVGDEPAAQDTNSSTIA